jgi:anti-sigma factor RsiW
LLTCKRFLQELTDFLDDKLDPEVRGELQKHLNECPNCWVVCDTTQKTVKIFKGMQAQILPSAVQTRLMDYLAKNCKDKKKASLPESDPSKSPATH